MDTRLLHALLGALHRGWHRGGDALHPDPRPTLLEALRDTYLAAAHTVTQVTRDAEHMAYPQFRARLLRMAAETQGHVTWVRDTLLARGGALSTGACPPTEAHNSWDALCRELAAARHTYDALLEPMHLAEQADPELAAGFRRLRKTTQQHRAGLLEMLVQSDPYALAWDPAALERARARSDRPDTALCGRAPPAVRALTSMRQARGLRRRSHGRTTAHPRRIAAGEDGRDG